MAIEVTLPRQGWSTDEAVFVEWLKQDGQSVREGEPLFAVETDKAVQEIESPGSGILRVPAGGPRQGDTVKVGGVIGFLTDPGEAVDFPLPEGREGRREGGPHEMRSPSPQLPFSREREGQAGELAAVPPVSPRAARRARQEGVDLRAVAGTGAGGRVRERDVLAAARTERSPTESNPGTGKGLEGRSTALTGRRRVVAERMAASRAASVPVTLTVNVDASALVAWRGRLKSAAATPLAVPTFADLMIHVAARALAEHPYVNGRWQGDGIVESAAIHIGLAVDTEAGLLVPVVGDVPRLTLPQLAARTRELIARARAGRLTPDDLAGGTFTVTNLGGLGIDVFTPIVNYPELAVLGVGRIEPAPAIVNRQVVASHRMWLSLTFDHRAMDGAPAAKFLATVRRLIEAEPTGKR